MVTLYVTAREKSSGNSAVCTGLGKLLINEGKKIGYIKPVSSGEEAEEAGYLKTLLSLDESPDVICPVISGNIAADIKESLGKMKGKDAVIIDGPTEQYQTSSDIADELGARLIIVESYSDDLSQPIVGYKGFGKPLLGVLFNNVPAVRMKNLTEIAEQLKKVGVTYLGALAEDRAISALTVGELAACINGEMVRGEENASDFVESLMLGAMTVDSGPEYFGRKENKAAIIRSERPDMQLAALATSTRCLVLTGDAQPKPTVMIKAEEKNIPVIVTGENTATVMDRIETALSEPKINQESKLTRLEKLMRKNLDLDTLFKELGFTG